MEIREMTYKDASAEALLMAMEKDKNVFLILHKFNIQKVAPLRL